MPIVLIGALPFNVYPEEAPGYSQLKEDCIYGFKGGDDTGGIQVTAEPAG